MISPFRRSASSMAASVLPVAVGPTSTIGTLPPGHSFCEFTVTYRLRAPPPCLSPNLPGGHSAFKRNEDVTAEELFCLPEPCHSIAQPSLIRKLMSALSGQRLAGL